jgi:hypothetical protein
MLKKEIRKKLLEEKETRKKRIVENELIKSRLSLIIESKEKFNSLSKDKQEKVFFQVMAEIREMDKNGLINEGLGDILSSLFGQSGSAVSQMFIEPMVQKILGVFFPQGFFRDFATSFIVSDPRRIARALGDCKELTKLFAEALSEAMFQMFQRSRGMDGKGAGFMRNLLGGAVKDTKFISGIESSIADTVCSMFGKYSDNAQALLDKVKPAVVAQG